MITPVHKDKKLKVVPIRMIILSTFIIVLTMTVAVIGYIVFSSWYSTSNSTIVQMAKDLNVEIVNSTKATLDVPLHINEVNHNLIEKGIVDMNNQTERETFFVNVLNTHQGNVVYSFSYGTESGEYYGARRNEDGIIQIMRNNKDTQGHSQYYSVTENMTAGELVVETGVFDPRTRAWYTAAKESKDIVFSPIYKHFIMNDLTVSCAVPIVDEEGVLKGILGAHIILSGINVSLRDIVSKEEGFAVIVEKSSGDLIANSFGMDNYQLLADGSFNRISIRDMGKEDLLQAYNSFVNEGIDESVLTVDNKKLYSEISEYKENGLDWLIISEVPETLLITTINENIRVALLMVLLAIFASFAIYIRLTKKFLGPIDTLIEATEKFALGDLLQRVKIVRNDEIGLIAGAYNKMADTIHEQINTLEEKVHERTLALDLSNQTLEDNKNRLRLILDSTFEGVYGLNVLGCCTFINKSGMKILGYTDDTELIGKNMHFIIRHSHADRRAIPFGESNIKKALEGKVRHVTDEVFWKKDGSFFDVEYYLHPQYLEGTVIGAVVTFMDNTKRKQLEELIFSEKEHFKTTLLSVGDGVISTDKHGNILVMNPVAEKITDWSQDEAKGKNLEEVLNITIEDTHERAESPVKRAVDSGETVELDTRTMLSTKTGRKMPVEVSAAPIRDRKGNLSGVVIVFRDFSEKKEKLKEIEYLSYHDSLTGLYNRHYMEESIRRIDNKRNLPLTIMVLDVNGLKLINDAFGHKMGDKLLKTVAVLLRDVCRSDEIIGRMGGDEFEILLPGTNSDQAESIYKKIEEAASKVKIDSLIVSIAVGFAVKKDVNENIESIKVDADNNMYKNKKKYGKTMRSEMIETVLRNINNKYDEEQIHTERVSLFCEAIAKAMGFSEVEVFNIKMAGALHDIGKITVPPELLNKSEKLTEKEFEIIRRHAETSYQILKGVDEYTSFAEAVLYHHERWDGKGYPEGLAGENIPLISRIIAVADAFEAMTANRVYQKPKSMERAIEELNKNAGTQFDTAIVKLFIEKVLL